MASLKLLKLLNKLMVLKKYEKIDAVRMTWMKGHAKETMTVLCQANGSISNQKR